MVFRNSPMAVICSLFIFLYSSFIYCTSIKFIFDKSHLADFTFTPLSLCLLIVPLIISPSIYHTTPHFYYDFIYFTKNIYLHFDHTHFIDVIQHFGRINNFLAELTLFITKSRQKSIPLDFCLDSVYNHHFSYSYVLPQEQSINPIFKYIYTD